MDKIVAVESGRALVSRNVLGADLEAVWVERCGPSRRIIFGTRGASTRDAFDSEWRLSCVAIERDAEASLIGALVGESLESEPKSLEAAVGRAASRGMQLSDLLDLMDRAGIAYAYACMDERGMACRAEASGAAPRVLAKDGGLASC